MKGRGTIVGSSLRILEVAGNVFLSLPPGGCRDLSLVPAAVMGQGTVAERRGRRRPTEGRRRSGCRLSVHVCFGFGTLFLYAPTASGVDPSDVSTDGEEDTGQAQHLSSSLQQIASSVMEATAALPATS